ncbi:uncharacterized protein LOC126750712 [Anthonomus grandis grandis]|uniref:uncharacterized protein LOC126750712 n=1 Tax=Anthonomus grandis grandis TaxID=2921223 RepID=UPI002165AE5B|nr:uncharacterized protein LOC126750712 [Anthonomus grandis grandis]
MTSEISSFFGYFFRKCHHTVKSLRKCGLIQTMPFTWPTKFRRPWIFALVIAILLWVLLGYRIIELLMDGFAVSGSVYLTRFPVFLHLSALGIICIICSVLMFLIFRKSNFSNWFSSLSFLLYVLMELLIIVNALTMTLVTRVHYIIEAIIVFVFLFIYTDMVSWQYNEYQENLRRLHEEHINEILDKITGGEKGGCVTISLHGSDNKGPRPGPSKIN